MRNIDKWVPSKYVYKRGKLVASWDTNEVGVGSRLVVDLLAGAYDAYIKMHVRGKLIDLGCGKVPLFQAYRGYATSTTCVEWNDSIHDCEYLDIRCDLTANLPFNDDQFDTVILSDVLEHIPLPDHLWKEMGRILTENGRVLLTVPFYYWIHEQPHDYYRYTEYALRRFAESSGFKVLELKRLGGVPEIIADILAKNLLRAPRFGEILASSIQQLTRIFLRTRFGQKVSEVTSESFPLEYFLIAEKHGKV